MRLGDANQLIVHPHRGNGDRPQRGSLKILCFTPWFPAVPGDQSGSFVLDSVIALSSIGHELRVLVSQPWKPQFAVSKNRYGVIDATELTADDQKFQVESATHFSVPRNYLRHLSNWSYREFLLPRLEQAVERFKPDLIHAHAELAGCLAVECGKAFGIPTVVSVHGINTCNRLNSRSQLKLYRRWLDQADRIVLVGAPLLEYLERIVGRTDHFRIVPNGFRFPNEQPTARHVPSKESLNFVSVSNLHEGKGIDLTLRALGKFTGESSQKWKYKVVGDGTERRSLEKLTRELGLEDKVLFVGACSHAEVYGHLDEMDVFILPSYREAFGIAYLEAMAAGLLAIGVEGQGPSAFIRHRETGLLVAPRSVDSLVNCLMEIGRDLGQMQAIAAAGRSLVLNEFSLRRHAERLTDVFEEIVKR